MPKTAHLPRLAILVALAAVLALGLVLAACEDTITTQVQTEVKQAALPDRILTIVAPVTGSVTPSAGSHNLKEGIAFPIVFTPAGGYTFIQWQKTGGAGTVSFADATAASTTVTLSGGDGTIQGIATNQPRTLTVQNDGHGTTSPSSPTTIADGMGFSVNANPSPGYAFSAWSTVSGNATFSNANASSTTVTITGGDATIKANFVAGSYSVTVNAGTGGTTTPMGTQTYQGGGASYAVSASPGADYVFSSWSVSPLGALSLSPSAASASITVTVTASASLNAAFAQKDYVLSMSSGLHGYSTASTTTPKAGQAVTITALPGAGYKFNGWSYSTSSGATVSLPSPGANPTTVTVNGGTNHGTVTLTPSFVQSTFTVSVDGTYNPGTNVMPSYFARSSIGGNYLTVLGSSNSNGTGGIIRSINISDPNSMSSGTLNYMSTGDSPAGLAVDPTGAKVYWSTSGYAASITSSALPIQNSNSISWRTYSSTSEYHSELYWDILNKRLFGLDATYAIRSLNQSSFVPENYAAQGDTGYYLTDSTNVYPITHMYGNDYYGAPSVVIAHKYVSPNEEVRIANFSTSTRVQYSSVSRSSDIDGGYDAMTGPPDTKAISFNHDDMSMIAVIANVQYVGDVLKLFDVSGNVTALGTYQIPGTAVSAETVYWDPATPFILIGGTSNGVATIWVVDAFDVNAPVQRISPVALNGYARVLSLAPGPKGSNANQGEYFAVVKASASGPDKLMVLSLGLHY